MNVTALSPTVTTAFAVFNLTLTGYHFPVTITNTTCELHCLSTPYEVIVGVPVDITVGSLRCTFAPVAVGVYSAALVTGGTRYFSPGNLTVVVPGALLFKSLS